jgi:hypothetical protein
MRRSEGARQLGAVVDAEAVHAVADDHVDAARREVRGHFLHRRDDVAGGAVAGPTGVDVDGHEARAPGVEQRFVMARVPLAADEEQGAQRRIGSVAEENHLLEMDPIGTADPVGARQGVAQLAPQPAPAVAPGQAEPGGERTQPAAKRDGRAPGLLHRIRDPPLRDRPRPDAQLHAPQALRDDGAAVRNAPFHIGHMMEYIQADIWVRFQRMRGHEVHFVCADDAHGAAIMIAADKAGKTPQEFVAEIAAGQEAFLDGFHISFDNWHSTDGAENHALAQGHLPAPQEGGPDRGQGRRAVLRSGQVDVPARPLHPRRVPGVRHARPLRRQLRRLRLGVRGDGAEEPAFGRCRARRRC